MPAEFPVLFDAHCHLVECPEELDLLGGVRTSRMAVQTAQEEEWSRVVYLWQEQGSYQRIVPGFGIHPWYAHRVQEGWLQRLEQHLLRVPHAFVGEIGLDKVAITPDTHKCEYDAQLEVFRQQVFLAGRLRRPVSVHCVRSEGMMHQLFRQWSIEGHALPPRIMMHSWGGTEPMTKSLLCLRSDNKKNKPKKKNDDANWQDEGDVGSRFFFSFSSTINGRAPKTESVMRCVPEEKIMIESDHLQTSMIDVSMWQVLQMTCRAKQWSQKHASNVTYENTTKFYNI